MINFNNEENLENTILTAPIGICLLDAATLTAEIVNDKFLDVAGKPKETILNKFYWDAFAEARIYYEAALNQVVATGEAYHADEVELMLIRHGKPEMIFVTFVYSPVKNKEGKVTKVAVWVLENTRQVAERQKVDIARAAIQKERDRLTRFFMQAPAGICILDGPELVFELVNPRYQQLLPNRKLLNRPIFEALPELIDQPLHDVLLNVYRTGEPYQVDELLIPISEYEGGPTHNRYFSFNYLPRHDEENVIDGILVFVFEVTDIVDARLNQQALNEELAATNEELAATNEETVATNEELTNINEALTESEQSAQQLLQQLEASETRFRFMLNAIPQQVWTATPDGALDYVNQVVCDDFGYSTAEIVGQGWQAFIHPDDLQGCLNKWTKSLKTGTEYVVEFRLKFHDGNYRWHLARAVPFAEGNQIKLWLGTNTNIELQKNNEQRKDEFLSIASHELKTPLTSIKAFNQLMKRNKEPQRADSFIDKSAEHIYRLERLINDLLDVTKINAGKMSYSMEPFSFGQMLRDSIESMQFATSHNIILESVADVTYTGDHFRLEQVMNNFLTNAIKYSPQGKKILVNSKLENDGITVAVQDFGIGIATENLDKLFDRYYRVDNTAMRFEGLGLGLFISSEILKRHNGSFWIESEKGKGSTFYFRLPLVSDRPAAPAIQTDTFYQDSTLTITYNEDHRRMEVDWTGFQDMESVKKGCMAMLNILERNSCDRIVNDNTHVLGNWSDAAEWVGGTWFPMMEKAGCKYFAHIFSPSTFSQLAAKKSIDIMAGIITTQDFTDIKLAEEWIDSRPR